MCRASCALGDTLEPLFLGLLSLLLWSLVPKVTLKPPAVGRSDITLVCLRVKAVAGGTGGRLVPVLGELGHCRTWSSPHCVGTCWQPCSHTALFPHSPAHPGMMFKQASLGNSLSCPSPRSFRALLSLAWPWWPSHPPGLLPPSEPTYPCIRSDGASYSSQQHVGPLGEVLPVITLTMALAQT